MIPLPAPPEKLLQCALSILLFVAGWIGCGGWIRLVAGTLRFGELVCHGFCAWLATLSGSAVLLCVLNVFSPSLFVALPLLVALPGWIFLPRDLVRTFSNGLRGAAKTDAGVAGLLILAGFLCAAFVLNLLWPSAAFDTWTYHRPVSLFLLQQGMLANYPTESWAANLYSKSVEFAAAWVLAIARWDSPARLMPLGGIVCLVAALHTTMRLWRIPAHASIALSCAVIGIPGLILSTLRDTGDVDIQLAAVTMTALAGVVRVAESGKPSFRDMIPAAVALGLMPGVKAGGLILGGTLAITAVAVLLLRRVPLRVIVAGALMAFVVFAFVSSHWLATNLRDHGNPFYPATVHIPGIGTLAGFPWAGPGDWDALLGVPGELRDHSVSQRFFISLFRWDLVVLIQGGHIGGWGPHIVVMAIPIHLCAIALCIVRKRFDRALLLSWPVAAFPLLPHPWWFRFAMPCVVALPLGAAILWQSMRNGPSLRRLLVTAWLLTSIVPGIVMLWLVWRDRHPDRMAELAREANRSWIVPQDVFRTFGDPDGLRDIYRWVAAELPPGARVGVYRAGKPFFPGLCFRPDFDNTLHEIDVHQENLKEFSHLIVMAAARDVPEARGVLATIPFQNDQWVVLRVEESKRN